MATFVPCYFDSQGYLVCPQQAAQAAFPTRVVSSPNTGWNAGAFSIATLTDDVSLTFNIPVGTVAATVGLSSDVYDYAAVGLEAPLLPLELLDYAVVVSDASATFGSGTATLLLYEMGVQVNGPSPIVYYEGTDIQLTRIRGIVQYIVDGSLVYTSLRKTTSPLTVAATLYCAGDTIP